MAIAAAAALASPVGGLVAIWRKPTSLFMSIALGFAGGVLLATVAFEMLPKALEHGSLPLAVGGFAIGFTTVYGYDLFTHRGVVAGPKAEQWPKVKRLHQRYRPRGGEVTVLAGATSAEELIEGLSIGVGAAIQPELGLLVALAIFIDNFSESLSIGELIRSERRTSWRSQSGRAERPTAASRPERSAAALPSGLCGARRSQNPQKTCTQTTPLRIMLRSA
jgi:zinc transporter, ZIP family